MILRWESLASEWLEKHTPCSKEHALIEIARLMPLGVRRGGKESQCKIKLAKEAIYRAYKVSFMDLPFDLPKLQKTRKERMTDQIKKLASRKEGMKKDEAFQFKNGLNLLRYLLKKNVLILDGDVYRLKKGNDNEQ